MNETSKAAHTPGPWVALQQSGGAFYIRPEGQGFLLAHIGGWIETHKGSNAANARLIAAAPDHALFGAAVCAGKARWEPWAPVSAMGGKGEVCVGGMRYATDLDEFGMPVLHDALRAAIAKARGEA